MENNNTSDNRYYSDGIIKDVLQKGCKRNSDISKEVLRSLVILAVELSREGREGRKIGTMFVVGDQRKVLKSSRTLILDPLKGHTAEEKKFTDADLRETVKELSQLDGAFVVANDGTFLSATRYIFTDIKNINVPLGLGSRHIAAASITRSTNSVAIVVSESSVVRIFINGKVVSEIIPELWLIQKARRKGIGAGNDLVRENITPTTS